MYYELTDRFIVETDIAQTWRFFSQAENLPRITPSWMKFRVVTPPPIELRQDSIIDYTIAWLGLPIRWRTRIIDWSPPRQFIDLQIRGPYTLWHHQHAFEPVADGSGTECRDRVTYKLPLPLAGPLMNALVVKRQLIGIFEFRQQQIAQLLAPLRMLEMPTITAVR